MLADLILVHPTWQSRVECCSFKPKWIEMSKLFIFQNWLLAHVAGTLLGGTQLIANVQFIAVKKEVIVMKNISRKRDSNSNFVKCFHVDRFTGSSSVNHTMILTRDHWLRIFIPILKVQIDIAMYSTIYLYVSPTVFFLIPGRANWDQVKAGGKAVTLV